MIANQKKDKKGVIYTCVTGNYDTIFNHTYIDSNWDYVCFTDNLSIKGKHNSSWKFVPIVFNELDNSRNQRWHKINPHLLFPEYKRSIWIDANTDILKKDLFDDVDKAINENRKISIGPHPSRNCIYQALKACIELEKDDPKIMNEQINIIRNDGFPENQGLFASGIIYREHLDKQIIKIMEDWWWWVRNHSKRDQLSFTYVLWKHGFTCLPLTNVTYMKDDGRVRIWPHNSETRNYINYKENLIQQKDESMQQLEKFIHKNNEQIICNQQLVIDVMKNSLSWRLGQIITWLPWKILQIFK
jgi:hypothetical protein